MMYQYAEFTFRGTSGHLYNYTTTEPLRTIVADAYPYALSQLSEEGWRIVALVFQAPHADNDWAVKACLQRDLI